MRSEFSSTVRQLETFLSTFNLDIKVQKGGKSRTAQCGLAFAGSTEQHPPILRTV